MTGYTDSTIWPDDCDERCPTGCNRKSDHEWRTFYVMGQGYVSTFTPAKLKKLKWPIAGEPLNTSRMAMPLLAGYSRIEDRVRRHLGRLHQRL